MSITIEAAASSLTWNIDEEYVKNQNRALNRYNPFAK